VEENFADAYKSALSDPLVGVSFASMANWTGQFVTETMLNVLVPALSNYIDGMNLYQFVDSSPADQVDPIGLGSTTQPSPEPKKPSNPKNPPNPSQPPPSSTSTGLGVILSGSNGTPNGGYIYYKPDHDLELWLHGSENKNGWECDIGATWAPPPWLPIFGNPEQALPGC
jgi:hypothetical protein